MKSRLAEYKTSKSKWPVIIIGTSCTKINNIKLYFYTRKMYNIKILN